MASLTDRIKWGIQFVDAGFYFHKHRNDKTPFVDMRGLRITPERYETWSLGINENTDQPEGIGIIIGVVKNSILHPKTMYDIYVRKK